jgi:hypothetical protein
VNHFKLFALLLRRGVPNVFVKLLVNWYAKLSVVVRWNGFDSPVLRVLSGVRQGGVLSPILFNFYVDDMIFKLRESGLGCHVFGCYVGCIMYADDLLLISSSLICLQSILDICGSEGHRLGMSFNAKKSHCIAIGPHWDKNLATLLINGVTINWSEKIPYLGIALLKGKTLPQMFP